MYIYTTGTRIPIATINWRILTAEKGITYIICEVRVFTVGSVSCLIRSHITRRSTAKYYVLMLFTWYRWDLAYTDWWYSTTSCKLVTW